jgi:anhydro-N-acetylmuramic acid kinase
MNDLYIGFMSGTSCDGVDASLIETDGLDFFKPIHNVAIPYDSGIRSELKELFIHSVPFLELEKKITESHIKAVDQLLSESGYLAKNIKAIGFHGQTIFHKPESGLTWQIGNPHLLASATKIDVVHDFRRRDVVLGGQGAPLIPIFHKLLARSQDLPVMIVNIGGVANLTYIDSNELIAFDTGPGNALIDDMMMQHYGKAFDDEGKVASSGKVDKLIVNKVLAGDYYNQNYPKSLDRNNFIFLEKELNDKKPEDIIATLTYLTSAAIIKSISLLPNTPKQIFICGGGAKNKQMLSWLEIILKDQGVSCKILNISSISGMNPDYVESQGFAYLAARFCNDLPSAFPTTTGSSLANICGCIVKP